MGQARDEAGNIWETDAQGNPVRLISAAGQGGGQRGGVYTLPTNPRDAARDAREAARDDRIANNETERLRIARENQAADLYAKGLRMGANGPEPIPNWQPPMSVAEGPKITAKVREEAINGYNNAASLERIADDLEAKFNSTIGTTKGLAGLKDYLPTGTNKAFDDTAYQARGYVKQGLGFTGGEGNTIGEIGLNYGPYLPEASDRDEQIVGKIKALRSLAADSRKKSIAILGGVPDANGRITPFDQNNLVSQQNLAAADPNATDQTIPIPPAMQREYDDFMAQWARNPDVGAYVAFRRQLDQKYNFPVAPSKDAENQKWASDAAANLKAGGATVNTAIPGVEKPMSDMEILRNKAVNNPLGAGAVGFTNAMSLGGVESLAGGKVNALRDARPYSSMAGEVAGTILGTGGIARAGRETLGRAMPGLLSADSLVARGARTLAPDMIYGAGRGGIVDGDPTTGALAAGAGSLAGNALGKAAGGLLGGMKQSAASKYLQDQGIFQTVGQKTGGLLKATEDRMMSLPWVGDAIGNLRRGSFQDFNQAAFRQAGEPIGASIGRAGEPGLNDLQSLIGQSYDNAVSGVTVPLDERLIMDLEQAKLAGYQLPPDLSAKFDAVMANRVTPAIRSSSVEPVNLSSIKRYEAGDLSGPQVDHEFKIGQVFDNPKPLGLTRLADGSPYLLDGYHRMGRAARLGKNELSGEFRAPDPATMRRLREEGVPEELLPAPASITGDSYQQVMRGLKGYKAELTKPGFEQDYRDALSLTQKALRDQMERGGGQSVVEGLGNADAAYRNYKTLADAVHRARNGTRSGTVDLFAPSQLNDAVAATQRKFPGAHPLSELGKTGQEVLPSKIPDSGTAGRLAQMATLGGVGGLGAGTGYATDSNPMTAALGSLAAITALRGGASKPAQALLSKLFVNPGNSPLRDMSATQIRKLGGLLGTASIPLLLQQ